MCSARHKDVGGKRLASGEAVQAMEVLDIGHTAGNFKAKTGYQRGVKDRVTQAMEVKAAAQPAAGRASFNNSFWEFSAAKRTPRRSGSPFWLRNVVDSLSLSPYLWRSFVFLGARGLCLERAAGAGGGVVEEADPRRKKQADGDRTSLSGAQRAP